MSLWVDKHRPTSLDTLDYHEELGENLKQLAASSDFPHLLVYGPSGAGKKTRILSTLKEIYGPGVEKMRLDTRQFTTPSNRKIEINLVVSNYHIELTPSDVGIYDRVVIQDLLKDAQTANVDSAAKRHFKVVVFNEADSMSRDAQAALRRTMEKYMRNLRVILCCNSTSKIIPPIRSRCLLVRVASPKVPEICNILKKVCKREGLTLPSAFAEKLAVASKGNLRKAILMLEAARIQQYPFSEAQQPIQPDWELYIRDMAASMLQEQSPARLLQMRGKFYELLSKCIPADMIIKTLALELVVNSHTKMAAQVIHQAAEYEWKMRKGNKVIFHLEAFAAKFMSLYKTFLFEQGKL